jgi:hypothetical protein
MNTTTAAAGAVALLAILTLPATGQAAPAPDAPDAPAEPGRPCFLVRAHWNEAIDGPQPTCGTAARNAPVGVRRVALDHLP